MFKNIFGNSPQTKILDFLADHPNYDYSISDIAKQSDVSRPTAYKVLDILLKRKLLIKTREMGNSSLYKLNLENKLVQTILKFDFEISRRVAELESVKTIKTYESALVSNKARAIAPNI